MCARPFPADILNNDGLNVGKLSDHHGAGWQANRVPKAVFPKNERRIMGQDKPGKSFIG